MSPLCSLGWLTFPSLKEGLWVKPVTKETTPLLSTCGESGVTAHEEMQTGFPFLSYWYTSILIQWELAGEIQGLLVMEKLWLA